MPKIELDVSHEEFEALLYLLGDGYESALMQEQNPTYRSRERHDPAEPLPTFSPEEETGPIAPRSETIKSVESKLLETWLR